MASVIHEAPVSAKVALAYALGVRRVSFAELPPVDGDDLLRTTLQNINSRELRGFKPLKELLTFSPGSIGGPRCHTLEVETLQFHEEIVFPEHAAVDLQTHALSLCGRYVEMHSIFKRHESEEETDDWRIAHGWGRQAYHARGTTRSLVLRRPRNHTSAEENLFLVGMTYQKVPHEDKHVITDLTATNTSLGDLREQFEDSFAKVAIEMFQRLKHAYGETVQSLAYQLEEAKGIEAKLVRLTESLIA